MAGTYSVRVRDAAGKEASADFVVGEPAALQVNGTTVNPDCNKHGSIAITVAGGKAPYSYRWENGHNAANRSYLKQGIYTVQVTDANNCRTEASFELIGSYMEVYPEVRQSFCQGNDGWARVHVEGGQAPYTYQWSNGMTTPEVYGLYPGSHRVTVKDAAGCTVVNEIYIYDYYPPVVSFSVTPATGCDAGTANGTIHTQVQGGVSPYTFQWSDGENSVSRAGLRAGIYYLTIIDAIGCVSSSFAVEVPLQLSNPAISLSGTPNEACDNNYSGTVAAMVNSATATYRWSWTRKNDSSFSRSGTETSSANISGLASGVYVLLVTDAKGCSASAEYTVEDQYIQPVILAITHTNQTNCGNSGNGTATVAAVGINGVNDPLNHYSYQWTDASGSHIDSGPTAIGLVAGTYYVSAYKNSGNPGSGCASDLYEVVIEHAPLVPLLSLSSRPNTSCLVNSPNGTIAATINSPTPNYSWNWSTASGAVIASGTQALVADLRGAEAGDYKLTVTPDNGCSITKSILVLKETLAYTISYQKRDVACAGESNGLISLAMQAEYDYHCLKDNVALALSNSGNIEALAPGTYQLQATNKTTACVFTETVAIAEPAPLQATGSVQPASGVDANDASISLVVAGGTAPYSYQWSNGATSRDISGLSPQSYSISVTDAQGCSQLLSFTIEPLGLSDGLLADGIKVLRTANGQLLVQLERVSRAEQIKIYRLDGKQVAQADVRGKAEATFNMPSAEPALYLLLVAAKDKVHRKKIFF